MENLKEDDKILTLLNNRLGKYLENIDFDNLHINKNNKENIINNLDLYEGKIDYSKKGIDFIYQYLDEKNKKK